MNYNILEKIFAFLIIGGLFYDSIREVRENLGLTGFSMLRIALFRVLVIFTLLVFSFLGINFLFSLLISPPSKILSWLGYLLLLFIGWYGLKTFDQFFKNKMGS